MAEASEELGTHQKRDGQARTEDVQVCAGWMGSKDTAG